MLKRSGESGHPCLELESFQLFTIEYYVGCAFVINRFIMLRYVPSVHTLVRNFIMNGC